MFPLAKLALAVRSTCGAQHLRGAALAGRSTKRSDIASWQENVIIGKALECVNAFPAPGA